MPLRSGLRFEGVILFPDCRGLHQAPVTTLDSSFQVQLGWQRHVYQGGVAGVDWTHYKHLLPEHVYDVYMLLELSTIHR